MDLVQLIFFELMCNTKCKILIYGEWFSTEIKILIIIIILENELSHKLYRRGIIINGDHK